MRKVWKVWDVPGGLERTLCFFVHQTARPNNKVKMAKERAVRAVVGQRMVLIDTNNRVNEARDREPVRVRAYLGSSSLQALQAAVDDGSYVRFVAVQM